MVVMGKKNMTFFISVIQVNKNKTYSYDALNLRKQHGLEDERLIPTNKLDSLAPFYVPSWSHN